MAIVIRRSELRDIIARAEIGEEGVHESVEAPYLGRVFGISSAGAALAFILAASEVIGYERADDMCRDAVSFLSKDSRHGLVIAFPDVKIEG